MTPTRGPIFDRLLMRLKDFIIIGTAAVALIKWFYLNPIQMSSRVDKQEELLGVIAKDINEQNVRLRMIEENVRELSKIVRRIEIKSRE